MIYLEIVNKPKMLNGKESIHNCECYAFEFNSKNNIISIYENYSQWYHDTPAFYFLEVVSITGITDKED